MKEYLRDLWKAAPLGCLLCGVYLLAIFFDTGRTAPRWEVDLLIAILAAQIVMEVHQKEVSAAYIKVLEQQNEELQRELDGDEP